MGHGTRDQLHHERLLGDTQLGGRKAVTLTPVGFRCCTRCRFYSLNSGILWRELTTGRAAPKERLKPARTSALHALKYTTPIGIALYKSIALKCRTHYESTIARPPVLSYILYGVTSSKYCRSKELSRCTAAQARCTASSRARGRSPAPGSLPRTRQARARCRGAGAPPRRQRACGRRPRCRRCCPSRLHSSSRSARRTPARSAPARLRAIRAPTVNHRSAGRTRYAGRRPARSHAGESAISGRHGALSSAGHGES